MSPIQCNRLADFLPEKYMLLVYCCDCHGRPEPDRSALPADAKIEVLRLRPVCSACNSILSGTAVRDPGIPLGGRHDNEFALPVI